MRVAHLQLEDQCKVTVHFAVRPFSSDSHRGLQKVRRIRNELERRGHNPLLFFLKCLEADDARLPELIRDEIKARTFFVLGNTRASRRSKWVRQEIELVQQVTKRPRQTVVEMRLARDLHTEPHTAEAGRTQSK